MFRIPRRRPSAALIVACCSLFVALGGTSYAVATGTIGSQEIRDGSIKDVDVASHTLRGNKVAPDALGGGAVKEEALDASKLGSVRQADHATNADAAETAASATTADAATRAGSAATADGLQSQVIVTADGSRYDARGVTDVDKIGAGRYIVTFDRDVSRCVAQATPIYEFDFYGAPDASGTGEVAVEFSPGGSGSSDGDRRLWVHTGTNAGVQADRGFHLLVSC
jgi:hypothetical protein